MAQTHLSRYASFSGNAKFACCAGRSREAWPGTRSGALLLLLLTCAALSAAEPVSYPREVKLPGGKVTVHHPSVSDWRDFSVLSAWVPMEIAPTGEAPWTGSVMLQAVTDIRFDERVVSLSSLRPVKAVADESMPAAMQSLKNSPGAYPLLQDALKQGRQSISLEYLLRALPADFIDNLPPPEGNRGENPPEVMLSEKPAILVLFDGPPQTVPIKSSGLEIVINTNWLVFHDTASGLWYLVFGNYWLQNPELSGGSWKVAERLPEDIGNLAMANGWESMKKILPPKQTDRIPPPLKFSYAPAELVLFKGPAQFQPLKGTSLQFAANADHDLFLYEGRYYLLLAGRWFSAPGLKGSWSFEEDLPAEFTKIAPSSEQAHVLSAVPGTEEYRIALIEAALPRSRSVADDGGKEVQVRYDGAPKFVWINGVLVERAVNTSSQVLRHNDNYYLCQDAAWYRSVSANGPWKPALEIPAEIYSIPPGDPAHNVTFVKMGSFDNNSGRQAYVHTYGYSGTYTADKGLQKGDGPTGSGTYYDPTYDPRQRSWAYWGSYAYVGYRPPYGYGARYYPHYGAYRYGGFYDPFWGSPYPTSTSTVYDVPDGDKDWVTDDSGQKQEVVIRQQPNYIDAPSYGVNATIEDSTAAGHWYSGPDGKLYRIEKGAWQVQQGKKWLPLNGPLPDSVKREYEARLAGYASYQRYLQEQQANPQ